MRALLASPPLALAAFAFASAALLAERLLAGIAAGAGFETAIAPLVFWIAVGSAFGAFWLVNAMRLAGLLRSPANRLTGAGALASAGIGAMLATADLGGGAAGAIALIGSVACFATFFLLQVVLRRLEG